MPRPLGNQREHDKAQLAVIEQPPRSAPAPVAAIPFLVRVPDIAVLVSPAAKMSAVMFVVSMFVMVVVSMSMSHTFFQMQFRYIELQIYLNYIVVRFKDKPPAHEQNLPNHIYFYYYNGLETELLGVRRIGGMISA
jgi:hypothetical protein